MVERRRGIRHTRPVLLALVALAGVGCGRGGGGGEEPVVSGARQVEMVVLRGPGGDTMALVPVSIGGQGPFAFALDTGASHSVIDRRLAERLGLRVTGPAVRISGVAAVASAEPIKVDSWQVGQVHLPPRTLVTLDLAHDDQKDGLQGLLGSDVLSQFDVILVDYKRQRLMFRPRPGAPVGLGAGLALR